MKVSYRLAKFGGHSGSGDMFLGCNVISQDHEIKDLRNSFFGNFF